MHFSDRHEQTLVRTIYRNPLSVSLHPGKFQINRMSKIVVKKCRKFSYIYWITYLMRMKPPISSITNTIAKILKYLSMNDLMGGPKK